MRIPFVPPLQTSISYNSTKLKAHKKKKKIKKKSNITGESDIQSWMTKCSILKCQI